MGGSIYKKYSIHTHIPVASAEDVTGGLGLLGALGSSVCLNALVMLYAVHPEADVSVRVRKA